MDMYYLGQIVMFAYGFEPRGFVKCDGRLIELGQNDALFALLGGRFGGDGRKDFELPKIEDPCEGVSYYICIQGIFPPRN